MRNRKILYFIFIIFLIAATKARANYQFTKISLEQGLSQSTVLDIVQDSIGYMWFATPNGLNRYNGYEVEVFRTGLNDSLSVCSRNIRRLYVDKLNRIWIGGESGISYYSYDTGYFKNYRLFRPEEKNTVTGIVIDAQQRIWLSVLNGDICLYNKAEDKFSKISLKPALRKDETINKLVDRQGELLVCTSGGLYRLDKKTYRTTSVNIGLPSVNIHNAVCAPNGEIWLATGGEGIYILDSNFRFLRNYRHEPGHAESLLSDIVRALEIDSQGTVWVGTFKGLSVLKPSARHFDNYQASQNDPFALSHNSIRSIYADRNGGVWIGTFYGGISYYHKDNIKFSTINTQSNYPFRLNDNIINAMIADRKGMLWFGTNDNGLNCWNPSSHTLSNYPLPQVKALLSLPDGSLLVGTHWGGLYQIYPGSPGRTRVFKSGHSANSIPDNRVDALLCDHEERIWVGTYDGLAILDLETGKFQLFEGDAHGNKLTSETILSLLEDSHKRIWIGTHNGLNLYHSDRRLLENMKYAVDDSTTLSVNEVTCIFEDSKKRIWVGTSDGLNLFDEVTRTFKRYMVMGGGQYNSFICAILEDKDDNLWISTQGGLIRFNPDHHDWQHFVKEDGLQSNQFNHGSAYELPDGRMLFGGLNGVTLFSPQQVSYVSNGRVLFTDLWVNDKPVRCNDGSGILSKNLLQVRELKLKHNQNSLVLKFSTINFNMNNKVTYQYRVEGLFDKWRDAVGNKLSLFDLPTGEYVLSVRIAPTYQHNAPEEITSLRIRVLPPWWRTLPMIMVYSVLFVVVLVVVYKVVRGRIRMHNELQVEKLKQKHMEEMQTQQMQFFVNISHEFKTPLTLIISPIEKLLDMAKNNEWQSRQLRLVYKNANLLLSLIDQLIHFRKAENGQVKLQVSKGNIIASLSSIYMSFHSFAKGKDITYLFESSLKEYEMYYDAELLERICFNFLSNAFKFTGVGGTITLRAALHGDQFAISVEDTGKGIPPEQQKLIFNRFYCGDAGEAVGGTGIGLTYAKLLAERHHGYIDLESEPGKGSVFTLNLPLNKEVYAAEDMVDEARKADNLPGKRLAAIADEEEKEVTAPQEHKEDDPSKRATILIADDNVHVTDFLRENLAANYNVDIAHDGQEALDMVEAKNYDLILSDVMMPKVNGIILCRKIKQNIKTCHIPVIILSAKSDVEHQIEGIDVGADDYIVKPFSMKLLESKIQNILNIRKSLKELYRNSVNVKPEKVAYFSLDQEFLEKAAKIVEEHMGDADFSVEFFAGQMAMSRSNLHLKFKAITGESISDFIKKIRFQKAIELLESGRYNIAEISVITGFSTPSYFSKNFKNLKSASNLNGNLNCSKELEHYAS